MYAIDHYAEGERLTIDAAELFRSAGYSEKVRYLQAQANLHLLAANAGIDRISQPSLLPPVQDIEAPSITCPTCEAVSYNPKDIQFGYCGRCHAFTSKEKP